MKGSIMKRAIAILAIAILATTSRAADEVITNYFAGYVYVPASMTNAGDTGLPVSNAFICFPAALLSLSATEAATATGDVRAIMYSINQHFYATREAKTNKSATAITRGVTYAPSGTNVNETVTHVIRTIRQFGSATLP